jgi:hypothetical protein
MEVRQTEEEHQDLGQLQLIKCKILVQVSAVRFASGWDAGEPGDSRSSRSLLLQGEETKPQSVRIEVCSDADLFFHYYHTLNLEGPRRLRRRRVRGKKC